jgi:uncharacterized DUF497 family protein
MRIRWNEGKREHVLQRRRIDFACFEELLCLPYIQDQRSDDPDQYRITGFVGSRLVSFIVECRQDNLGEYIWVVTAWNATREERVRYEAETSY